jgi:TolA-binding protein
MLNSASDLLAKQRRAEAEALLNRIAREFPRTEAAPQALVQLAQLEEDLSQADNILSRVIADYPNTEWAETARYRRGEVAMLLSDYPAALKAFEEYLARNPRSTRMGNVRLQMALCYIRLRQPEKALEQIQFLSGEQPLAALDPETLETMAECHIELDRCDLAVPPLEVLTQRYPSHPNINRARLLYGLCLEDAKRFTEAIGEYERLLSQNPKSGESVVARTRLADLNRPLTLQSKRAAAAPATVAADRPSTAVAIEALVPKGVRAVAPAPVPEVPATSSTVTVENIESVLPVPAP